MTAPRPVPDDIADDYERTSGRHIALAFLTITHRNLVEPLRVVSDVHDYIVGDATYIGMPFGFKTITDTEAAPSTEIRVQNIDRRIGEAILAIGDRPKVTGLVMSSADFDLTQIPRVELTTARVLYRFEQFELVDVTVDAIEATGRAMLRDYSREPWPGFRATMERCPGLFR